MKRILYLGAGMDLTPIWMYPDVKEFVYIDQLPRNALCEYGIIYHKGLYIPKQELRTDFIYKFLGELRKKLWVSMVL